MMKKPIGIGYAAIIACALLSGAANAQYFSQEINNNAAQCASGIDTGNCVGWGGQARQPDPYGGRPAHEEPKFAPRDPFSEAEQDAYKRQIAKERNMERGIIKGWNKPKTEEQIEYVELDNYACNAIQKAVVKKGLEYKVKPWPAGSAEERKEKRFQEALWDGVGVDRMKKRCKFGKS